MAAQMEEQQQEIGGLHGEQQQNNNQDINNEGEHVNGTLVDGTARQLNGLDIADDNAEKDNEAKEEDDGSLNGRGNEEKKIFCGGISYDTTNEDLSNYFGQFGPVKEAQVKFDRMTGRSRGFAFVEFETAEACKASLVQREQNIKGKQCEIKPAKTREIGYMNKKVFVGGLPNDFSEDELRKHFQQYGQVEDIEWPFDKQTKARKNFAFVVFEDEEAADRAAANPKQQFASRECDVKKAVPQNKRVMYPRGGFGGGGGAMALRGAFASGPLGGSGMGGGVRGGAGGGSNAHQQVPLYPNAAAAAQWYQMQQAAWYNAAYNGGAAWYGAPTATPATGANATSAQWYNSAGNNAAAAAQATQWYGNWYGQQNNGANAAAAGGGANNVGEANGNV